MSNTNGAILWEKGNVSFIVTGLDKSSANEKTGAMLQSWILRNDVHPTEAVRQGKDSAICGDCPFRGNKGKGRGCYVNLIFGPNNIYKSLRRYSGDVSQIAGKVFRFGSYGDPAYVPVTVLKGVAKQVKKFTGYTHAWRKKFAQRHKQICMASVETLAGKREANAMGWRTFRVTSDLSTQQADEVICPASNEAGKKLTCAQCGLCNGNWSGKKKNVVIKAHGSPVSAGKHALQIAE